MPGEQQPFKSPALLRSSDYKKTLIYPHYVSALKIKHRWAFCLSPFMLDSVIGRVSVLWRCYGNMSLFEWCDCMFVLGIPDQGWSHRGSRVISVTRWLRQKPSNGFSWIHMEMRGWQSTHTYCEFLCVCVCVWVTEQKSIIFVMGEIFYWTGSWQQSTGDRQHNIIT